MRDDLDLSVLCGAFTLIHYLGVKLMGEKREAERKRKKGTPPHHPCHDLPINLPHSIMLNS